MTPRPFFFPRYIPTGNKKACSGAIIEKKKNAQKKKKLSKPPGEFYRLYYAKKKRDNFTVGKWISVLLSLFVELL